MIRRLIFLMCGSALLAVASVIGCQLVFPDVVPYATDENAQQAWRREAAFLVTTIAWLMAEVSAVRSIGLVALLWNDRRADADGIHKLRISPQGIDPNFQLLLLLLPVNMLSDARWPHNCIHRGSVPMRS